MLRLKRVLMAVLAEQGVELPIPPDGPMVRMIDQEIVREQFYACTPAEGTPEQKGHFRRQQFLRALDWAEEQQLIGVEEIDGVTYLRLTRPERSRTARLRGVSLRRLTSLPYRGSEVRRPSETVTMAARQR